MPAMVSIEACRGGFAMNAIIENGWLVNFPQYGEKDDIATIAIQEEDLRLLPDGMNAAVNEEIRARFEVLEKGAGVGDVSDYMI